jgi:hypothetical protein
MAYRRRGKKSQAGGASVWKKDSDITMDLQPQPRLLNQ